MDYRSLDETEIAGLIAILQQLVMMDGIITVEERAHVLSVSQIFDPELYGRALTIANKKLAKQTGFDELVDAVLRPEARRVIYELCANAAVADGEGLYEEPLLAFLRERWDLSAPEEDDIIVL